MSASIVQDDGGGPVTGSVDNGSLVSVTVSNADDTGILGWQWEFIYRPIGSTAVLLSPNAASTSFTPDVTGTFLLRLTTYVDAARTEVEDIDEEGYAIRLAAPNNWRIPAAGESRQYDSVAGWAIAREEAIRATHAFLQAPASAPSLQLGSLLWAWNGEDTSQFDAAKEHRNASSVTSGSTTLTVVDRSPLGIGNVLRVTSTSLVGGSVYQVLESELPLPARYVMVVNFADAAAIGLLCSVYPFCKTDVASDFDGLVLTRGQSASLISYGVQNYDLGGSETVGSAGAITTPAVADRGGIRTVITVNTRPNADATALAQVNVEDKGGNGGITYDGIVPSAIAGVSPNWDNQNHNRIGIGAFAAAAVSSTVDFGDFRIYAHPDD